MFFSAGLISEHANGYQTSRLTHKVSSVTLSLSGHIQLTQMLFFESPHVFPLFIPTIIRAVWILIIVYFNFSTELTNPFSLHTAARAFFQNWKYFTRIFLIQIFFLQKLPQPLPFPFFHVPQHDLHSKYELLQRSENIPHCFSIYHSLPGIP